MRNVITGVGNLQQHRRYTVVWGCAHLIYSLTPQRRLSFTRLKRKDFIHLPTEKIADKAHVHIIVFVVYQLLVVVAAAVGI